MLSHPGRKSIRRYVGWLICAGLACAGTTSARQFAQGDAQAPIGAAGRSAVLKQLGKQLEAHFVLPDQAGKIAAAIAAKNAHRGYAGDTTVPGVAKVLTVDLRRLGQDRRFAVAFLPDFAKDLSGGQMPSAQKRAAWITRHGYGIT